MRGIQKFREHFKGMEEYYILIGGAACYLHLYETPIQARATKDLDIILTVEAMNKEFIEVFWSFISEGGYQVKLKANGRPCFYRFEKPKDQEFPEMIELLARNPEFNFDKAAGEIIPIKVEDYVVSLSAILLDEDYYSYVIGNSIDINGINVAGIHSIILLKIYAWLDLSRRKDAGELVNSDNVRKHRSDVFRLIQFIDPTDIQLVNSRIQEDVRKFIELTREDKTLNDVWLKNMKIEGVTVDDVLDLLTKIFVR